MVSVPIPDLVLGWNQEFLDYEIPSISWGCGADVFLGDGSGGLAFSSAIALDGSRFESHWALGRALVQTEQFAEAVDSLKKAVALAPDRSDAHYQLGLALRRLGRNDEAAREFALVEKLNKEFRTGTKQ